MEISINICAVVFCIAYSIVIIRNNFGVSAILFYTLSMQAWSLLSCLYNDFGVYNKELDRITYSSFATTALAMFFFLFNYFASYGIRIAKIFNSLSQGCSRTIFDVKWFQIVLNITLCGFVGFYSFVNLLNNSQGLTGSVDRYQIYSNSGIIIKIIIDYSVYISFFIGYLGWLSKTRGYKLVNLSVFILFVLFQLSIGHKFSSIFDTTIAFFIRGVAELQSDLKMVKRVSLKVAISALVCFSGVLFYNFYKYTISLEDKALGLDYLVDRLLGYQGHLWWGTYNLTIGQDMIDPEHWLSEVKSIFKSADDRTSGVGMLYVMELNIGARMTELANNNGYLYTMAYPALLLVTFPFIISILVQMLAGFIFGLIIENLSIAIRNENFVLSVLITLILFPYLSMLQSGFILTFFTVGLTVKIVLIMIIKIKNRT